MRARRGLPQRTGLLFSNEAENSSVVPTEQSTARKGVNQQQRDEGTCLTMK